MKRPAPETEGFPPEERQQTLSEMQAISDKFYGMVFKAEMGSKAHAFVEFTGVMNEFITLCRGAEAQGIDFTTTNTHSGKALPMQPHNADYLAEKLNCIYGPALLSDKDVRDAFIATLFGGEFRLVEKRKSRLGSPA